MTTQHFSKFIFLNKIFIRSDDTFQFLLRTFASQDRSVLRTDEITPVVQCTWGACTEIHHRALLSSVEIIDLLQAENTVLVKAQQPVLLSLWSCNDKKTVMKTSKGVVACPPTAGDLTSRNGIPSDSFSARPMMDNRAADVSGSSPLITVPEEPPDWSLASPPPAPPASSITGWKWKPSLSVSDQSVDGIGADEMHRFESCTVSWRGTM